MTLRTSFFKIFIRPSVARRSRPKTSRTRLAVEQLEDRIALTGSAWTPLGPSNITGISDGGIVSGRVTTIATDPNPTATGDMVFVGTAGGGVWKGQDINGTSPGIPPGTLPTWTSLTDNLAAQINDPLVTLSVGAIAAAVDTSTGNTIIYVGLGEANAESTLMSPAAAASQFYGAGMLKGVITPANPMQVTWTLLGGPGAQNMFYGSAFSKIIVDPLTRISSTPPSPPPRTA